MVPAALVDRILVDLIPVIEAPSAVRAYSGGSWGPDIVHDLISPRTWALPGA